MRRARTNRRRIAPWGWGLIVAFACASFADSELEFANRRWSVEGEVSLEEFAGRTALRMRNGAAQLIDVEFENGTIEFDVRTSGERSFVGLAFRAEGSDREHFYLRPHNSGRFDAMQYTPVFNGSSAWQLYPEDNASLEIPPNRWLHVKLVIAGPRMEAFFEGETAPTLVVPYLRRGRTRGALALWSNFPGAESSDVVPTAFADFVLRNDGTTFDYPEVDAPPADSGLIGRWAISESFPESDTTPAAERTGDWQVVAADREGRVNLARWVTRPAGGQAGAVLARIVLRSDRQRVARLGFGFSDRATIYLAGRPIFRGNNTYRSRSLRYLGVMGVDNDVLYLPLQAGDNELLFAVSESFGGWGVTARLLDPEGIEVRATAPDPPP